jgi:hypothetical protein
MTQAFNLSQLANKVNSSGELNASTGLSSTVPVDHGGTGQTTYTNGQLLIGNTTGNTLTKATLTAGSGISITNGAGSISIASTVTGGVTSLNGQTGAITNTAVNAIGSYVSGSLNVANAVYSLGTTVSGSSIIQNASAPFTSWYGGLTSTSRSGTYRAMNRSSNGGTNCCGEVLKTPNLWVRIS